MKYKVESWYDRKSKNWITQILDDNNYQIGNAWYDGNKDSRDVSIKEANDRIKELTFKI